MKVWKEAEKVWLERNNARRQAYHDALALWNEECAQAKVERKRAGWAKPKLGKLKSLIPKPVVDGAEGDEAEGDNDEDDERNSGNGLNEDNAGNNESDSMEE
ncbi:hypothetical protein PAXRUDRAFT_164514 [Paxillus rubicundulus Ve08.2h10]|uniref:Unplaced genomic scaffold scaffold_1835, whole genome shotgun sequence n=1 Tax=Paxillus rubicundulus Ve08.2h10 TaxID=930991 RepID=A0A0D0DC54_9AGAM|nr:hypothetical protein PAXRUDRAFT_164514 [Paxillus rubicundulus Ve08.2h10]